MNIISLLKKEMLSFSEVQLKHTVYIKARTTDTISSINKDIKKLEKAGYKYLFIDEATLMEDFIEGAVLFSDVYAATGMKIVLSGDDSLGLYFAEGQELYDRTITIHTTFISFRDDGFMLAEKPSNGRVKALSEACLDRTYDESARRYIDTAICKNIQHSLRCYERFCQAQALVYSLLKDDQIKNLDAKTIQLITDKIIEGVLGHMLEDIVIFETKRELAKNSGSGKKSVYKIRFENHEYDMLVYDANTNTCEAYEIKHTTEPFPNQYRHLVNEDFVQAAEKRFGQITKRCVFYRDKTYTEENGIEYKNVEEYLCELGE